MSAPRDLSVTRDGRGLAYTVTTMSSNLWSLPVAVDGRVLGEASQLMQDTSVRNTLPAISPDGQRVAYHARRRGAQGDIFVQNPDGTSEQVTNHPAADLMPSWTPDGKAIVYSSTRNGGNELWRVSLTDATETRLLGSPHLMAMAKLSPDGRWALFHRYDNYLLGTWRALIQTGEATRLTPEGESMGYPCWSRDGKWVAVEREYGDWTEVGVVPADGGAYRVLTKEQGQNWPHSWSPNSTKVAMAALRDGTWNLWWVGLDGKERRLTDYRSLRTYVRYPEWSPTGERIVFEFAEAKGNIYLMNLD
jgi:TolB protein